jgi:predicted GTPase
MGDSSTVTTVNSGTVALVPPPPTEVEGGALLLKLAALADALGVNQLAGEARDLASRISEGRFYVACVGQFKRGKSTLINALLGEPVLPTGFVPVTAVPTVIRFGERLKASIQSRDRRWQEVCVTDLERYVSEEHNPENVQSIAGVEVFVPSPLLSEGLCLVDTPGLGSVFANNTASTQRFIPHIDATLVVTGADPPLAGEELALVEAAARHAPDLILVLNKADRTTDAERAAAASFARALIERRLQRAVGPVFEVSASERLENRGPERDWEKLRAALERLVRQSGRQLIRAACERGVMRLSEHLLALIREEREALQRPLEESERRIRALRETVAAAERSMRELAFLLMAEQQHLSDVLGARHRAFTRSVLPLAREEFQPKVRAARSAMGPSYRRGLMREAQEIARQHVLPWLGAEEEHAEDEYRQVARRFVQMSDDFLKHFRTRLSTTRARHGNRISGSSQILLSGAYGGRTTGVAASLAGRPGACPGRSPQSNRTGRPAIPGKAAGSEQHPSAERYSQPRSGESEPAGGRNPEAAAADSAHVR